MVNKPVNPHLKAAYASSLPCYFKWNLCKMTRALTKCNCCINLALTYTLGISTDHNLQNICWRGNFVQYNIIQSNKRILHYACAVITFLQYTESLFLTTNAGPKPFSSPALHRYSLLKCVKIALIAQPINCRSLTDSLLYILLPARKLLCL